VQDFTIFNIFILIPVQNARFLYDRSVKVSGPLYECGHGFPLQVLSGDMLVLEILDGQYSLTAMLGSNAGGRYRDIQSLELKQITTISRPPASAELLEQLADMKSIRRLLSQTKTTHQLPQVIVAVVECLSRASDVAKEIQQLSAFYAIQCNGSGVPM
jgi:hypothetical protein